MKLKTSPSCDRCSSPYETLSHLLYECSTVQIFWQNVIAWWNEKRSEGVLYGYKPESSSFLCSEPFPYHCQVSCFSVLVEHGLSES